MIDRDQYPPVSPVSRSYTGRKWTSFSPATPPPDGKVRQGSQLSGATARVGDPSTPTRAWPGGAT